MPTTNYDQQEVKSVKSHDSERCHFVKFDIYFLGLSKEIFFGVITDN